MPWSAATARASKPGNRARGAAARSERHHLASRIEPELPDVPGFRRFRSAGPCRAVAPQPGVRRAQRVRPAAGMPRAGRAWRTAASPGRRRTSTRPTSSTAPGCARRLTPLLRDHAPGTFDVHAAQRPLGAAPSLGAVVVALSAGGAAVTRGRRAAGAHPRDRQRRRSGRVPPRRPTERAGLPEGVPLALFAGTARAEPRSVLAALARTPPPPGRGGRRAAQLLSAGAPVG
jgi:hypothetical protein